MSNKPLPLQTEISRPFWNSLAENKLTAIQCGSCGKHTFYPRKHCQHCLSHDVKWVELSGEASLYSYTIARIPTLPEFADEAPQILAVVELKEGVRMNSTLIDVPEEQVNIGMPLRAVLNTVTPEGQTLVRFTRVDSEVTNLAYVDPLATLERNAQGQAIIPIENVTALTSLASDRFSNWSNTFTISQDIINQFAALSGDDYWIHTDPEKSAKDSPYGTTIAHGALVQILQSKLKLPLHYEIVGFNTMVNYGSNKIRFPAPVPVDSTIHARAKVKSVDVGPKGVQLILEVHTHVVDQERPSVINELVIYYR